MRIQSVNNNRNQYKQNFGMITVSGKNCRSWSNIYKIIGEYHNSGVDFGVVMKKGSNSKKALDILVVKSTEGTKEELDLLNGLNKFSQLSGLEHKIIPDKKGLKYIDNFYKVNKIPRTPDLSDFNKF